MSNINHGFIAVHVGMLLVLETYLSIIVKKQNKLIF